MAKTRKTLRTRRARRTQRARRIRRARRTKRTRRARRARRTRQRSRVEQTGGLAIMLLALLGGVVTPFIRKKSEQPEVTITSSQVKNIAEVYWSDGVDGNVDNGVDNMYIDFRGACLSIKKNTQMPGPQDIDEDTKIKVMSEGLIDVSGKNYVHMKSLMNIFQSKHICKCQQCIDVLNKEGNLTPTDKEILIQGKARSHRSSPAPASAPPGWERKTYRRGQHPFQTGVYPH